MGMKPTVPDDGALQQQIGTAYDTVKLVADSLPAIYAVLAAVDTITGSYVLKSTTVNNKPLSGNISLNANDVGARASTWVPTWAEVANKPTSMAQLGFSLLSADIPNLDTGKLTSGTLPVTRGGTGRTDNKAAALATAITFTMGSTSKSFDGSAAVSWTLAEIGAQAANTNLAAFSGLTGVADRLAYFTGAGTLALSTFTLFGRSIVAAVDATAVNTLLGVQTKADADLVADLFNRATLDYDFVRAIYKEYKNKYLTEIPLIDAVTCARNGTGTADHPFGVVTYDINEPRVQYNPVTGARLGLLAEETRTNLLLHSQYTAASGETPPTGWNIFASTGVTTTSASPRFTGTIRATQSGTAQRECYVQTLTLSADTTYTLSCYFAAGTSADNIILRVRPASGDTPSGTLTLPASAVTAAGTYSITFTTVSGGAYEFYIGLGCSANATGTVIHETPQLEVGTTPSTYIPTTAAALQRLFTLQTIDSLPAQLNLLKEYTVYLEFTANDDIVLFGAGNTFNDCFYIANKQVNIRSGGNSTPVMNIAFNYGVRTKVAFRVKAGDYAAVCNGILGGSNNSAFIPPVGLVRATVGSAPWETVPSLPNQANMVLHKVALIPSALTNAEMQLITK